MSQNKTTSTVNNGSGNKDLSCLRCRKKKAKCSKTRPACTRCARSNQPCEYPDAPPNLTDLSQKVLSLYDTLRELEDKFMLQYATQEQEQEMPTKIGEKRRRQSSSSSSNNSINSKSPLDDMPSIESLSLLNQIVKRPRRQNHHQQQQNELSSLPGNWSMSLTSHGLSLHAVARNMIEFSSFAKDFSQQLRNNDPENKLTKSWEWYEEESIGDEYDDDPLDEDEYLVTVPVYSLPSLLDYHKNDNNNNNNNNFVLHSNNNNNTNISNPTIKTIDNVDDDKEEDGDDDDDDDTPYYNRIRPFLDDLINYLRQTYNILSMDQFPIHLYHIITLLQQLRPFIPFDQKLLSTNKQQNPIQLVCTITAYAASIRLLSSTHHQPSQSTQLVDDCIHYATMMLIELVFQQQQQQDNINPPSLPIVSCAALLSWMGKSEMAHLATRAMYGSDDWDENNDQWRHLAASLLYHQVYSMVFSSSNKKNHYEIIGEAEVWLLRSAKQLAQQKQTEKINSSTLYFYGSALGLETELVCLLKQVFGLFYNMENQNENKNIRKVDVDDVLKLVQNIEEWEHGLPKWVQWSTPSTQTRWLKLKMHIHLIHNIVKILLFRPFSIQPFQQKQQHYASHEKVGGGQEEQIQLNGNDLLQTHTRTTFLNLSLAAADRATICIRHLHDDNNGKSDNNDDDAWVRAGDCLAKDVTRRVKEAFPCDDELFITIQGIENRLVDKEIIKVSSLPL